jgi:hypothetical protein
MREIGLMAKNKGKEHIVTKKVSFMKGIGLMVRWKVREYILGKRLLGGRIKLKLKDMLVNGKII